MHFMRIKIQKCGRLSSFSSIWKIKPDESITLATSWSKRPQSLSLMISSSWKTTSNDKRRVAAAHKKKEIIYKDNVLELKSSCFALLPVSQLAGMEWNEQDGLKDKRERRRGQAFEKVLMAWCCHGHGSFWGDAYINVSVLHRTQVHVYPQSLADVFTFCHV